jgi:hypothetical protein
MKPLFIKVYIASLLMCIPLIILISCSKHDQNISNNLNLKTKQEVEMLSQIRNLSYIENVPGTSVDNYLSNANNPYEIAGNTTEKILSNFFYDIKSKKSDPDSLKSVLSSKLNLELPESILHPDTTDLIPFEETLKTTLFNLLSQDYNTFVSKSIQIENIIICSDYLNDLQKKRVLVYSSVLRHNMGAAHQILYSSKGVEESGWEEFTGCWMGKASSLSNCSNCKLERFFCKVNFISCYSIWAGDCLIDMM